LATSFQHCAKRLCADNRLYLEKDCIWVFLTKLIEFRSDDLHKKKQGKMLLGDIIIGLSNTGHVLISLTLQGPHQVVE
jgi:hypothetical protein